MSKPIAWMTQEELAALTPEQMVEAIMNDNFDRESPLARGMVLNLSRDTLDCLNAVRFAERERAARIVDDFYPTGRASDLDKIAALVRALD